MVLGDIASGENRRIVTAPLGINDNPAIDSEPGIARQFEIQIDADPHHYRIEGFPLAVAVQRRQAVIIFQLQRAAAAANINALPAMQLIQRLRDLHTDRAHAQRRLLFIKGHGYAAFARRGGDFEANPAAADDRQPRCRCQPLLQTLRVLPVAQGIYLRMLPQASDGSRARRRWRSAVGRTPAFRRCSAPGFYFAGRSISRAAGGTSANPVPAAPRR